MKIRVEMNPVRAKLVKAQSLIQLVNKDWAQFLSESITAKMRSRLQKHERTGRPGISNLLKNWKNRWV